MIHDQVERCYTIADANFATDFEALITAKGLGGEGFTTTATIVKRQTAETFVNLGITLPAVGVYARPAETGAKSQGRRQTRGLMVYDYYCEDDDPSKACRQRDLAAEASLKLVDRIAGGSDGVYGAGELMRSVTIELEDGLNEPGLPKPAARGWARAIIAFPVWDEDTGL